MWVSSACYPSNMWRLQLQLLQWLVCLTHQWNTLCELKNSDRHSCRWMRSYIWFEILTNKGKKNFDWLARVLGKHHCSSGQQLLLYVIVTVGCCDYNTIVYSLSDFIRYCTNFIANSTSVIQALEHTVSACFTLLILTVDNSHLADSTWISLK